MTPQTAANCIRLIGWGFILFGVIFVSIAFSGYDGIAHLIADLFDWTSGPHDEVLTRDARWFGAIFSGLSVGFGAFYVFLVAPLLTLSDLDARRLAKRGGLIAAVSWFVVDSAGSFAASVPSNVVMNFIFLLAIIVPLLTVKFPSDD